MTTQDYKLIAEAISTVSQTHGESDDAMRALINTLIPMLYADNARFDGERFRQAAEAGINIRKALLKP